MPTTDRVEASRSTLDDSTIAEIRALSAARVTGFPPITREQAALVRAALTSAPRQETTEAAVTP